MSTCVFDDDLKCIYCGYVARKPNTRRQCVVTDRPLSSMFDRVSRYASAVRRWIAAGRPVRTDTQVESILAICRGCEHFDGATCAKCGCKVNRSSWGLMNKLRMATESCPIGKWGGEGSGVADMDGRLRVGFVTPNLMYGGVDSWVASLCREWSLSGAVHVNGVAHVGTLGATHDDMLREIGQYAPVVSAIDSPLVQRVAMPIEAVYAIADHCDALIVWSVSGEIVDAIKASGVPVVIGVSHGCSDWWMRSSADVVTHWAAVSQEAALAVPVPCPAESVAVIPNGVDLWRCDSQLTKHEARERLGVSVAAKVVGYVGRFADEKNTAAIRRAVDLLPDKWHAIFCGRGARIEPGPRVRVVEPTRQIGDIWRACDVAVMASSTEGHSLSADEALACGVPLVSTRVGTVAELGDDAATWIEQTTPTAIADGILRASLSHVPTITSEAVRRERSSAAMAGRWAEYLASLLPARIDAR